MLKDEIITIIKNNFKEPDTLIADFNKPKYLTLRVNTLKTTQSEIINFLKINNIEFELASFSDLAVIIKNKKLADIEKLTIYKNGLIYLQSLSSQLPPIILDPKPKTDILDMCAAPGSKTTQIAALINNDANILACEKDRYRFEKLNHNLKLQQAKANTLNIDSKTLDNYFQFDNILLDAPCSSFGTIILNNEKSYKYLSKKLIINSSKLQYELLIKALTILKKGQTMIYSTCSILSIENEDVLIKAKQKINFEIVPIEIPNLPLLPTKLKGVICVRPNEYYEGFFVAKLKKL